MTREEIILYPEDLVDGPQNILLRGKVKIWVRSNGVDENVFDIAEQDGTVDEFDPLSRYRSSPARESCDARMHEADFIKIFPARVLLVVHRDEFYKVSREEILAELDLWVFMA